MKVKEIDRTANVAWSPAAQHPIYLAAGTAAQQLDATFSTTASLEIYALNLTEPGLDMSLKGSISSDCRFHKLVWGPNGNNSSDDQFSMIVGGADGGNLFMFDPKKLVKGEMALVCQRDKHTGPVTSLDFNPFQLNLLASGASESEIFLWDLNNPNNPMTPGAKSQPGEDVTCVAWNMQVQHILASTFAARCVVWDLRKNEPIIKVSDSTSRMRCKCVAWHPEVATQMCLASEDDNTPVIQLWDLRFATAPLKSLESHQRGVLSIAWCRRDPDLLLSCGKDNRILCWNPNSNVHGGEVLCELPTSNQWSFDVAWCPRNPAVIASSSFDGHVSIYSLMGGQQQVQPSSKIVDAFPGTDPYSQAPMIQAEHRGDLVTLKKPPKWLRTPVRASFGFGGKLISFVNNKLLDQPPSPTTQHTTQYAVYVSQMITEPTLIARSTQLETTIRNGQFNDYCHLKINDKQDEKLWSFVKANFDPNPRMSFLNLLGYDPQEVGNKISTVLKTRPDSQNIADGDAGIDAEELAQRMSALGSAANSLRASPNNITNVSDSRTPDSALNFSGDGASAFDTIASAPSEPSLSPGSGVFNIPTDDEIDGLISKALLTGNIEVAVDLCLSEGRLADAIILGFAGGQDLLLKTQRKYFKTAKGDTTKLISAVVHQDWGQVVHSCEISCWKEALAACLTYAKPNEFSALCEVLGSRLEAEPDGEYLSQAMLCYICAGNIDKLAECWVKHSNVSSTSKSLQDLVELTMILKHAVEQQDQAVEISSGVLAKKLTEYANLLAAQGSIATALSYLGNSNEQSILMLRNRLYKAIGQAVPGISEPANPFPKIDVKGMPNGLPQVPLSAMQQPLKQQHPSYGYAQTPQTAFPYPSPIPTYQPPNPQPQVPVYSSAGQVVPDANQAYFTQKRPSFGTSQEIPGMPPLPPASSGSSMLPPPTSVAAGSIKPVSKGHLANRYPTIPQDPSVYGNSSIANNNFYNPSAYPANPAYSQALAANYNSMNAVNNSMQSFSNTAIYNPGAAPTQNSFNLPPKSNTPAPPPQIPVQNQALINSNPMFAKPGWNDPPFLRGNQSKTEYETPAPITRPIFNAPEPDPMPMGMYPSGNSYASPPNVTSFAIANQMQPQQPPRMETPQLPSQPVQPEPPKPKPPIPTENQILFDVFEDLKNRCIAAAQNPQSKRKLDDVSRKLETLYDKLRENTLSQGTILGLHQIVQVVQQYNYQSALQIHAQIVSGSTFSEISSFMPALKVLLQTAMQLGV